MKAITVLVAGLGLVSAQVVAPAPIAVQGAPVDPNALAASGAGLDAFGENSFNVGSGLDLGTLLALLSGGFDLNSLLGQGFDLNSLLGNSLNLAGLGGGLNLGSIDLNNQQDVLNGIQEMMGALCLNSLDQIQQLEQLSQVAALEMFLQLVQLMALEQSGVLNLNDLQSLDASGNLFGGNGFNAGLFGRAIAEHKRTITDESRRLKVKRQSCQQGVVTDANGVPVAPSVNVAPASGAAIPTIGTTPADVSGAAPAAAPVDPAAASVVAAAAPADPAAASVVAAAAPVASVAAAAPVVAGSTDPTEPLSDFTR